MKDKTIILSTKVDKNEPKQRNFYNGDIGKMIETVRVKNFISQKQLPDTLHLTANVSYHIVALTHKNKHFKINQRSACPGTVCLGSLMQNSGSRKDFVRSNTEIFSQAVKFIEEFYMHQKKT